MKLSSLFFVSRFNGKLPRSIRWGYLLATSIGCALIGLSCLTQMSLLLNLTPSVPMGLYRVKSGSEIQVNNLIAFRLKERCLIKEVVGGPGDLFCVTSEGEFTVNGKSFGKAKSKNRLGKPLERHLGCQRVLEDEWVVYGYGDRSFDSRYFGTVKKRDLLGKAILVQGRSKEEAR